MLLNWSVLQTPFPAFIQGMAVNNNHVACYSRATPMFTMVMISL